MDLTGIVCGITLMSFHSHVRHTTDFLASDDPKEAVLSSRQDPCNGVRDAVRLPERSEGSRTASKSLTSQGKATRARDRVFDVLFFVETGAPYQTGDWRSTPRNTLGRIRKATEQAKEVGYTPEQLAIGVKTWPSMYSVNITAISLVTNMPRLLHVAAGGTFPGQQLNASQKLALIRRQRGRQA
jgi:hypothetical protein